MSSVQKWLDQIERTCSQSWTVMEVCGGQTHALLRFGIDQLLSDHIQLIHGPGCPVCVTPLEWIDQALALALEPKVILCSYGDMLRVPGRDGSTLLQRRAMGADVRVVTTPFEVLALAQRFPQRRVLFLAVGFETTAPATALLARRAFALELTNVQILVAHVRLLPALNQLLAAPGLRVQAILAAGHVCTVMGDAGYGLLAERHHRPVVITGFSAEELLRGILESVSQLERGEHSLSNAYPSAVSSWGNVEARRLLEQVFEPCDRDWRGLGRVEAGGYRLRAPFHLLGVEPCPPRADSQEHCLAGQVLQGLISPDHCPHFARECTPQTPLGAPMVSQEGACAAHYLYRS